MTMFEAVLLGIIQGITEFLPVSSSGHLVLAQHWLGITENALTFDVMVHAGSLLAIVVVLKDELLAMVAGVFGGRTPAARAGRTLFWQLVVATLPLVAVGLLLRDRIEQAFSSALVSVGFLFLTGGFLLYADRKSEAQSRGFSLRGGGGRGVGAGYGSGGGSGYGYGGGAAQQTGWGQAMSMGIAQAFAVLPGLSRSGVTMGTGMMSGLSRESAARFSFLMSIPAILGATILELRGFLKGEIASVAGTDALAAGAIASAITTYLAVVLFLRFIRNGRLAPFAYYTWILGAVMLWLTLG